MNIRWFLLAFALGIGMASAAPPATPRRRAAKLDHARTAQERGSRVHVLKDVIVVGREQRPMAVIDLSPERFSFSVGTARHSQRDRPFLPAGSAERW